MILEVAILPIKEGQSLAYEKAFKKAENNHSIYKWLYQS